MAQIRSTASSLTGNLERWASYVPERPAPEYQPYRALGIFRTDSVNISMEEAAERKIRNYLMQG